MTEPSHSLRHPGEILFQLMADRGFGIREMAMRTGYTQHCIAKLLVGDRPFNALMADAIAQATNTSPNLWLQLQAAYDADSDKPGHPPLSHEKDAPKMLTAREERMRVKALNKAVEIVCNDPAVSDPDGQRTVAIAGAFLDFLLNGNDPVHEYREGPLPMPPLKGRGSFVPPSKGGSDLLSVPPAAEPPRGVVDTAPPAPKKNTGTPKKKKAAKAADKAEQRTSDTAKKFSDWRKQNTKPAPAPEEDDELLHDTKHMIDDKGTVPQWVICPKCLTKGIIGTQHNCLKGERVTFSADMPTTRAP